MGCSNTKTSKNIEIKAEVQQTKDAKQTNETNQDEKSKKEKRIMIIFYSMYGHVEKLAREILMGVNSIPGVKGELWAVEETLSKEVLQNMGAAGIPKDINILTHDKIDEMKTADGFLFGMPTRFGAMPAQMKQFWDSTGKHWQSGALVNKPAGLFFSTGTQGGGQETTAWTAITQLTHHGMLFVPVGYSFGAELFDVSSLRGGSPYGTGTYAGADGKRMPSELELRMAKHQGEYMAKFVNRIKKE
jgi:NAD(P)H dehydrogenase (quinone)